MSTGSVRRLRRRIPRGGTAPKRAALAAQRDQLTGDELVARGEAAVRERGGDPQRRESNFRCPDPTHHENGDAYASARWNSQKKAWYCPVGNVGGGYKDLARRLG